jgi:hypothetical protein
MSAFGGKGDIKLMMERIGQGTAGLSLSRFAKAKDGNRPNG